MSCGALIIGSDTQPVREVIKDGENGLLVPFHDSAELSEKVIKAVERKIDIETLKERARSTILEKYSLKTALKGS